jgi:single stranded DNA-binding protein
MRDLNKTELLGTIGREVKTFVSKDGLAITNIPITTVQKRRDKTDISTYHTIVCFAELAEMAADFQIGDRIFATGSIQNDSYEKDGQKVYVTKIKATHLAKLASELSSEPKADSGSAQGGKPAANFLRGESSNPVAFPYHDNERQISWSQPGPDADGCSYASQGDLTLTCAWQDPSNPKKGGSVYGMREGDKEWKPMGSIPNTASVPF